MAHRPRTEHEFTVNQWQQASFGLRGKRFVMNEVWGNHTHPDLELNLLLSGQVSYLHCGKRQQLKQGQLVAFWAGLPHGIEVVSGPVDFCWLGIPLQQLLIWGIDSLQLSRLVRGAMVVDKQSPELDRLQIPRWIEDLDSQGQSRQCAVLEVQARVLRLLGSGQGQPRTTAHLVSQIMDWLGAHYAEPVTVADVAAGIECNPQQAMRSFKQTIGMTIIAWLNQLRVGVAARLMVHSHLDLNTIAVQAGFGSRTQFYHHFKQIFAINPGTWRDQNRIN